MNTAVASMGSFAVDLLRTSSAMAIVCALAVVVCSGCGGRRDDNGGQVSSIGADLASARADLAAGAPADLGSQDSPADLGQGAPDFAQGAPDLGQPADLAPCGQPDLPPTGGFKCGLETLVQVPDSRFVIDDDSVYSRQTVWSSPRIGCYDIFRTSKAGGTQSLVASCVNGFDWIPYFDDMLMAADGTRLYWTTGGRYDNASYSPAYESSVAKDGSDALPFVQVPDGPACPPAGSIGIVTVAVGTPSDVAAVGGHLYSVMTVNCEQGAAASGLVSDFPYAATTMTTLASPATGATHLALDDSFVYWASASGIWRVLRTGGASALVTTTAASGPVAVDDTNVYFGGAGATLYAVPKAGGKATLIYTPAGQDSMTGLVAAGQRIYRADVDSAGIDTGLRAMRPDGSDVKLLAGSEVDGLRADGNSLYLDSSAGIQRTCLLDP